MANARLTGRFDNLVRVVNQSCTQVSNATVTAAYVPGSKVVLEAGQVQNGLTLRWTCGGVLAGGNAAFPLTLVVNGTTVFTLTSDAATAGDYTATVMMVCYGGALQKLIGNMINNAEETEADYAAGTADLRGGAIIELKVASGHTSDTVTVEVCTVEAWNAPLET